MPDRMPRAAGEAKPHRSRLLFVGLPVFTVFAAFGIIVWLAYQEDARVPLGEPPLITAIAAPYKVAPDDPGGRQVPDQGEINRLLRDGPEPAPSERVLPLPEEPRRPVVTLPPPEPAEEVAAETSPESPLESSDRAVEDADARREAETALARLLADVGPGGAPAQQEPSQPPAATEGAIVPAIRPATKTAPTTVLGDPPPAAATVEGPSREADEALARLLAEIAGVSDTSEAGSTPPGTVAALAPARSATRPPGGASYRVQLAAVREQDDAGRAWKDLAERLGPLVADYEPFYERAETSNGVFTRIQLGPFASEQAADRLCVEVQRQNASCFVVSP